MARSFRTLSPAPTKAAQERRTLLNSRSDGPGDSSGFDPVRDSASPRKQPEEEEREGDSGHVEQHVVERDRPPGTPALVPLVEDRISQTNAERIERPRAPRRGAKGHGDAEPQSREQRDMESVRDESPEWSIRAGCAPRHRGQIEDDPHVAQSGQKVARRWTLRDDHAGLTI